MPRNSELVGWVKGIAAAITVLIAIVILTEVLQLRRLLASFDMDVSYVLFAKALTIGLAAIMAQNRNRPVAPWLIAAVFFDLAFVILIFLPGYGYCPDCNTKNTLSATHCRSCGRDARPPSHRPMVEHDFNAPLHGPRDMTEQDL